MTALSIAQEGHVDVEMRPDVRDGSKTCELIIQSRKDGPEDMTCISACRHSANKPDIGIFYERELVPSGLDIRSFGAEGSDVREELLLCSIL